MLAALILDKLHDVKTPKLGGFGGKLSIFGWFGVLWLFCFFGVDAFNSVARKFRAENTKWEPQNTKKTPL